MQVLGSSTVTGSYLAASFLFSVLFSMVGYRISMRHQLFRGVTPWRFPSLLWAAICFLIGPVGVVVELVAEITTKPKLPSSLGRVSVRFDQSAQPAQMPSRPYAAPAPAPNAIPAAMPGAAWAPPPVPTGPPPPRDPNGSVSLFGWYPDPTARHQQRYFDGRGWSEYVRDGDARSSDPL